MFFHVTFLVEPLATVLARVGPRVAAKYIISDFKKKKKKIDESILNSPVDEQVCGQSAAPLEAFATLFALEHLLCAVDRPGVLQ